MGRPIKKKFFANLNAPYQNQATGGTTGYGGEGVASYGTIVAGSGWASTPTVTVSAPDFAFDGAATATVQANFKALSAVATAAGSGYNYGNVLTQTTGVTGIAATWTVSAIKTGTMTILNDGTNCDVNDEIEYSGTYGGGTWTTPLRIRVTGAAGGNVTGFTVVTPGVWSGATRPTTTVGATFTQVVDGTDHDAADLSFTFNNDWGVSAVTKTTDGDYVAFTSGAKATTVSPAGGTGATLTITSVLESVDVLTPGRGYTATSDAAIAFSGGTGAAATAVLTSSYQNGLRINAFVKGGSSAVLGDIMKQEASHRYLVKTAQGQSQCKLVASDTPAEGQMNLIATDANGSTYWVTKLTARRCVLTRRTMSTAYLFATNGSAGWNITTAVAGKVSIANV
jgi:hypothetical protein